MKTKTTFELDSGLLKQLKTAAARAGVSVRELLTEGAQAVLDKYQRLDDRDVLQRRAREARHRFVGSFSGPGDLSANIDRLVSGVRERPLEYSAAKPARRRRR